MTTPNQKTSGAQAPTMNPSATVIVRYVGTRPGSMAYSTPQTGRYLFGNNANHRQQIVNLEDWPALKEEYALDLLAIPKEKARGVQDLNQMLTAAGLRTITGDEVRVLLASGIATVGAVLAAGVPTVATVINAGKVPALVEEISKKVGLA